MLSLVLPKGSLERATLDLFDAADLTVRRSSDRDYHATIDDPRIERVRFLRPQEIPSYVEQGLFDFGITGRDWITETGADVASLGELQYSKATSDPVRVVLAVPASVPWQTGADLPDGVRISTEFPALTRRYLEEHGVKAVVIPSYGATEAKVPDIVDAIVDLTETGASLHRNGLRILDTLLTSYTELIANHDAYADPAKRDAMEDVALLLRGAIRARGSVLLKLNVSAADLAAVTSYPARHVLPDDHLAGPRRHARRRGRGAQARRQHADPGAEGGGRAGHPGDPDQQDRGVSRPCCSPNRRCCGRPQAPAAMAAGRAGGHAAPRGAGRQRGSGRGPAGLRGCPAAAAARRSASTRRSSTASTSPAPRVPAEALSAALAALDPAVRAALTEAARRARLVHEAQLPAETWTAVAAGSTVTERYLPVRRAGVYVPGGLVAYPSSVLMNVIPAQVAGVAEIAVASPPQAEHGGLPHPAILAACALFGITEVHAAGGAQAIAMLGYGTDECAPVDVISGPGNVYVAAAKRLLRDRVAVDAEAGPTEIAIVADDGADASFIAADLVAQAEHDPLAACLLITTSAALADRVDTELAKAAAQARHAERVQAALAGQSACVMVDDANAALAVADAWAPEHLEIQAADAAILARRVRNAGRHLRRRRGRRCRSATTWPGRTTCCRPAAPPATPAACRCSRSCGACTSWSATRPALADVAPHIDALGGAEDLAAHVQAVRVRVPDSRDQR